MNPYGKETVLCQDIQASQGIIVEIEAMLFRAFWSSWSVLNEK